MTSTKHPIVLFLFLLQHLYNPVDFGGDKKYIATSVFLKNAYPLKTQNATLNPLLPFVFFHKFSMIFETDSVNQLKNQVLMNTVCY